MLFYGVYECLCYYVHIHIRACLSVRKPLCRFVHAFLWCLWMLVLLCTYTHVRVSVRKPLCRFVHAFIGWLWMNVYMCVCVRVYVFFKKRRRRRILKYYFLYIFLPPFSLGSSAWCGYTEWLSSQWLARSRSRLCCKLIITLSTNKPSLNRGTHIECN